MVTRQSRYWSMDTMFAFPTTLGLRLASWKKRHSVGSIGNQWILSSEGKLHEVIREGVFRHVMQYVPKVHHHISPMSLSLQCNVPAIKGRWCWNNDDRDLEETTLSQCDLKLLELQQRFSKQTQLNLFALLKWVSQPKIASISCNHPSTVQPNLLANRKPSSISRHTTPRVFHHLDISSCQLSPSTFGAFGSVFRPASTRANITFWVSRVSPKYASTFAVLYPQLQIKTRVGKIFRARVHCLGVQIALWFNCRHCRTIPRSSAIRPCHISWSVSVSRRSTTLRSLPRPLPRPFMALAEITMTSWDIHGDRMVKDHNGLALGLKHAIRFSCKREPIMTGLSR